MVREDYQEIVGQTQRYLKHQRELFGDELILERPDVLASAQILLDSETLDDFYMSIRDCQKCSLSETRTHFVFGTGNQSANLMLIGEAPVRDEDLQGEPFVGKAGQLLDKILFAIGFQREEVYICNILKCRLPENRDPFPEEIVLCLPYLLRQIEIIQPKIILALGQIAAQTLVKTTASLDQVRGKVHEFQGISVMVTYHPAALLHNPQWKRPVWEDVQKLRRLYDERVGDKLIWHPPKK